MSDRQNHSKYKKLLFLHDNFGQMSDSGYLHLITILI